MPAKLASKRERIAEHARSNFGRTTYVDAQVRQKPMYRMTAKGLTGKKALAAAGEPGVLSSKQTEPSSFLRMAAR